MQVRIFDYKKITYQVESTLDNTDDYDVPAIVDAIHYGTDYTDVDDIPSDEYWDIVASCALGQFDISLNTSDAIMQRYHVTPSAKLLECESIQSIMRDYADICDWCTERFAETHKVISYTEEWAYVCKYKNALRKFIIAHI